MTFFSQRFFLEFLSSIAMISDIFRSPGGSLPPKAQHGDPCHDGDHGVGAGAELQGYKVR